MAGVRHRTIEGDIRRLWTAGSLATADDRALLARFALGRDATSEETFRLLVERHGPMVLRVCRQVIGDRLDAEEAAQAVFLVLARKASSIRVGGALAPWLHGVARRVASKTRARSASRRRAGEGAILAASRPEANESASPPVDDWAPLHDEVARLAEKYRTPVVLCYLQGLTYEQAAARIGCPVGTVRVRLSRARDRLRARLGRRGYGPAQAAMLGRFAGVDAPPVAGAGWVEATTKVVGALRRGRSAMLEAVPSSVLSCYEGMGQTMVIDGCKSAFGILAAGMMTVGAVGFAATGRGGQEAAPPSTRPTQAPAPPPAGPKTPEKSPEQVERERLVDAARQRLVAQLAYYKEGRITIDRLIDASRLLMETESILDRDPARRLAAAEEHAMRMGDIEQWLESESDQSKSPITDLVEIRNALQLAMLRLEHLRRAHESDELEALRRRVDVLEKRLDDLLREREVGEPRRVR